MKEITLKAYAKINLSIDVLGKRPDGYHEVDMVMQQVDLWDQVTVRTDASKGSNDERMFGAAAEGIDLKVEWMQPPPENLSIQPDVPADHRNLAWKAAALMRDCYRERGIGKTSGPPTVEIRLEKHIPMAAGLAGGSADGAAVLHGLNRLWELEMSLGELMKLGGRLGADVPFCVMGQAALNPGLKFETAGSCGRATGEGKTVSPLPPLPAWILLAKPDVAVSTGEIYGKLNFDQIKKRPDTEQLIFGLQEKDLRKVVANMRNVLENISVKEYPVIMQVKEQMELMEGAFKVMMSGSGPTVFGVFSDREKAGKAYEKMKDFCSETFLVKTL